MLRMINFLVFISDWNQVDNSIDYSGTVTILSDYQWIVNTQHFETHIIFIASMYGRSVESLHGMRQYEIEKSRGIPLRPFGFLYLIGFHHLNDLLLLCRYK